MPNYGPSWLGASAVRVEDHHSPSVMSAEVSSHALWENPTLRDRPTHSVGHCSNQPLVSLLYQVMRRHMFLGGFRGRSTDSRFIGRLDYLASA
jgi:hypothetical protein